MDVHFDINQTLPEHRLRHLRGDADSRQLANTIGIRGMCRFGTRCCSKSSLPRQKFGPYRNPFDCATPRAVRSGRWALGLVAMLEAVTALFGIMSAGIFIAHAVDGYRSRA